MPRERCDTIVIMNITRPGKCRKKRYQRVIHPAAGAAADSLLRMSDIPRTYIFEPPDDDEVEDEEYEDVEQELESEGDYFDEY